MRTQVFAGLLIAAAALVLGCSSPSDTHYDYPSEYDVELEVRVVAGDSVAVDFASMRMVGGLDIAVRARAADVRRAGNDTYAVRVKF